ncbi:MAG: NUDIX domain-containing protein, partial [Luteitalea sp.]|nr:NUDIX domain-containing protein [Luteitalea sp.]
VIRHRGSVVLIPQPSADCVTLVYQYRYAIDQWVWELPAGSLEPGEEPEDAARRECHEEVGLVPDHVERLAIFYPTPGYSDEVMLFYRLTGLQRRRSRRNLTKRKRSNRAHSRSPS